MTVEIEIWQLIGFAISLLSGFAGILFAAGKIIAGQFDRRQMERFDTLQKTYIVERRKIDRIEREFLDFKAALPVEYVRREDYVRGQSIVEAKLDGLATKIDNVQLRAQLTHTLNHGTP